MAIRTIASPFSTNLRLVVTRPRQTASREDSDGRNEHCEFVDYRGGAASRDKAMTGTTLRR